MPIDIPITIAAKNEARAIERMLESLLISCASAEVRHDVRCQPLVVLDDCTDDTGAIAERHGVACISSSGGKVEAQRQGLRDAPFNIFADADILIDPPVIGELIAAMLEHPDIQVAFPVKHPLPPRRQTPLARALHRYNQRPSSGGAGTRRWFSGKLFAIRAWSIPAGFAIDDMYLSRVVVRDYGSSALYETPAPIWFRAPETLVGMYRYYNRMRRESERLDMLLPETVIAETRFGGPPPGVTRTPTLVRAAFLVCQTRYAVDRSRATNWPVIDETKWL